MYDCDFCMAAIEDAKKAAEEKEREMKKAEKKAEKERRKKEYQLNKGDEASQGSTKQQGVLNGKTQKKTAFSSLPIRSGTPKRARSYFTLLVFNKLVCYTCLNIYLMVA